MKFATAFVVFFAASPECCEVCYAARGWLSSKWVQHAGKRRRQSERRFFAGGAMFSLNSAISKSATYAVFPWNTYPDEPESYADLPKIL